jgi:O-antigen ligase
LIARLGGIALLIPLVSALSAPALPIGFRILLLVLWIVAIARPHWAILAAIAIVPFASWLLEAFDAPAVHYAEAVVLAVLSGALIAAARPPRTPLRGRLPALGPAVCVFGALLWASAAVMLQVMQAGTHTPWPFVRGFFVFLTRDYLIGPPGAFAGVADAALLAEGIALACLVARHARDHVARPAALFTAVAVSGALAAAVTLITFVAAAMRAPTAREIVAQLAFSRMGVTMADVNAAGSFFAMTTLLAVALAINRRHQERLARPLAHRAAWIAASVLMAAAMWISGSRMALVATLGGLAALAAVATPRRFHAWPRWATVAATIGGAVLLVVIVLVLDPRPSAARTASRMLTMRADFMITGLRMIASAPLFGVGVGRYFEMSGQFMPSSIYWFYFHENAHNNFLQIAGELGLTGLATFLWLLGAAAIRIARGLRADPGDRLLLGASVSLGAFVATWMTSHPMLVAEVAYPFWMLLGVAIARADGNAQPPLASDPAIAPSPAARPGFMRWPFAVAALVALLAVSVPIRAERQMAAIDFGRFSFGFYEWEGDPRFRWTTRRATFFIPAGSRQLHLPLRAIHIGANRAPTEVSIAVGGRTFHRVSLADDNWVTVSLRLPPGHQDEKFQRIDIVSERTWSPSTLFGRHSDVRTLGVQLAEPVATP